MILTEERGRVVAKRNFGPNRSLILFDARLQEVLHVIRHGCSDTLKHLRSGDDMTATAIDGTLSVDPLLWLDVEALS